MAGPNHHSIDQKLNSPRKTLDMDVDLADEKARRISTSSSRSSSSTINTNLSDLEYDDIEAKAAPTNNNNDTASTQLPPPPDGGLQAWTQVACGWLAIFTTWGYLNSFGAFQAFYTDDDTLFLRGVSPSAASLIGSIQVWLTLVTGIFSGRLLDAGYFLPTFCAGAALQVGGILLMSFCDQYWQLMLTQGVLTGIGCGLFFTPSLALVSTYFDRRRALAMGLVTTGNSVGGIVYPVVVRQLIPMAGFAWTARVLALINCAFLVVVGCFFRSRLPPNKNGAGFIDVKAFKDPIYVGWVLALFMVMLNNYFGYTFIASFGSDVLNMEFSAASLLVVILNGSGLIFRVIPPLIADKVGPLNVLMPVAMLWSLVAWTWLAVDSVPALYAWTVFYGIATGSFQCLMPTATASITPRLDMVGTRLGMAFAIMSIASLTGPPLGGYLQTSNGGSFTTAQIWAASMVSAGFLLVVFTRYRKLGWARGRC